MENIISYLRRTYDPTGIICYGSYCDGTQNEQSDFDALLLTDGGKYIHDTSVVDEIRLDVFVYPQDWDFAPEDMIQVYGGAVVLDDNGVAEKLMQQVQQYVDTFPKKTNEERKELKSWCEKMLIRSKRGDAEGQYRSHWLLTDSLQIYCEMRDRFYFGPQKTLLRMKQDDPTGFALLIDAMADRHLLDSWIQYIFANY